MSSVQRLPLRAPVTGVAGLVALLTLLEAYAGLGPAGWTAGLAAGILAAVLLAAALRRSGATVFGPANSVTLVRAVLGQGVAALVAASFAGQRHTVLVVTLTAVALLLDLVDGQVARRTRSVTPLGARFDMESDAFLILVLSLAAAPVVGWWVLAIGTARYALLLAEQLWPWLRRPVPPRHWRKVVAAVQGVALAVVLTGLLPAALAVLLLCGALVLLAESFGRDVVGLAFAEAATAGRPVRRELLAEPAGG